MPIYYEYRTTVERIADFRNKIRATCKTLASPNIANTQNRPILRTQPQPTYQQFPAQKRPRTEPHHHPALASDYREPIVRVSNSHDVTAKTPKLNFTEFPLDFDAGRLAERSKEQF